MILIYTMLAALKIICGYLLYRIEKQSRDIKRLKSYYEKELKDNATAEQWLKDLRSKISEDK